MIGIRTYIALLATVATGFVGWVGWEQHRQVQESVRQTCVAHAVAANDIESVRAEAAIGIPDAGTAGVRATAVLKVLSTETANLNRC
jgi:hypothetical protein